MRVQNQSFVYSQQQIQAQQAVAGEKAGKTLPPPQVANAHTESDKFDFTNMTMKELSQASKALYDEGVLTLGQHASLSLHYTATATGLNQGDGQVSLSALSKAENEKVDVIAMQKERLREATANGAPASQIAFSKELLHTLEAYQFGGAGKFHASA
ncbi:hypothetical protein N473_10570 [Pseudoalteromonas luteoviolacea CPMOR-1]|uniref:Uncharacterized protein n=1 Tax=Pseudoalteromonas luteoviolacea CPMOR-1 TaxID=1365248 RepID=A0A167M9Q3_9GAMM|nr:hypothetical protein [Pseudoalteromonas luteoviolacea]KZN66004.1 hypothetical protein N473_10570 [Pseudoalteromonas luteoviolacea CPMOR-1]